MDGGKRAQELGQDWCERIVLQGQLTSRLEQLDIVFGPVQSDDIGPGFDVLVGLGVTGQLLSGQTLDESVLEISQG